ncbi:MAG: hypothetical protein A2075_03215 [Geobacteraceae bacterium GWC2_58_44]|nr:MAG: hypothetical protein A2075_03215 [Geobacteraceae bacterium GWC2_58_44]HBG05833.1 hypothetical protein [Geobacter sp.]
MARIILLLFVVVLLSFDLSYAEESSPDYEKVSAILFPDTANWYPLKKMKPAEKRFLRKLFPELRRAYSVSRMGKEWEGKHCSFIERAFSEEYAFPGGFYLHDLNVDGIQDVIYSGSTQCAEGNSTLIWFGTRKGYEVKQDVFWPMQALRIKEGNPVKISSVEVSCCGAVTDEYFVGPLNNLRLEGTRRITSTTEIPETAGDQLPFSTKADMHLRSSAALNDTYDEEASGFLNLAVFGNILSKYLPGCTGNAISRRNDAKGDSWCFVILDEACEPLRFHIANSVSAGWTSCGSVTAK